MLFKHGYLELSTEFVLGIYMPIGGRNLRRRSTRKSFGSVPRLLALIARAELAEKTLEGAQALLNTDPHHWSRAWLKLGSNCDFVDNNICESFNKWIVEARYLPIISMVEAIRCKVMIRIHDMNTKGARWQQLICPNILKKLKTYINSSTYCHAICCGRETFEVQHFDNRWTVDLERRTCLCRYWQLSGLPCPHAISCIYYRTNKLDDYMATCFIVDEFMKTYDHFLKPVEGMQNWPTSEMAKPLPPKFLKMPGRPKKERRREPHEKPKGKKLSKRGTVIRCSKCKQTGHNRSSCDRRNTGTSNKATSQSHINSPNAMVILVKLFKFSHMYLSHRGIDLILMYTDSFANFTTECNKC